MLVLITSEKASATEAASCNLMFEADLQTLHLRLPGASEADYSNFLDAIYPQYHSRIMLHGQHQLGAQYKLKGLHYTEQARKDNDHLDEQIRELKKDGLMVSSSFHSVEEIDANSFDYCFLSPVFNSISKKNYSGKEEDVKAIDAPIIGLGGIHENNLKRVHELGYSGVAVLGAVWKDGDAVENFKMIQIAYQQHFLSNQKAIA